MNSWQCGLVFLSAIALTACGDNGGSPIQVGDVSHSSANRGGAELPDHFPNDVPISPDIELESVTGMPTGFVVMGTSEIGAEKLATYYTVQMLALGWTEREGDPQVAGPMTALQFRKDSRLANFSLMQEEVGVRFMLTLVPSG